MLYQTNITNKKSVDSALFANIISGCDTILTQAETNVFEKLLFPSSAPKMFVSPYESTQHNNQEHHQHLHHH